MIYFLDERMPNSREKETERHAKDQIGKRLITVPLDEVNRIVVRNSLTL